jgi:hypothetical protein
MTRLPISPRRAILALTWLAQLIGDVEVAGQRITAILYLSAAVNDVIFVLTARCARRPTRLPPVPP